MSSAHAHSDLPGRILAIIVFLIGVGLLCLVFGLAWSLFRSPVPGLELPVKPGTAAPPVAGIGVALTAFARQILLLALMTFAGSLIAGKGIQLYFTAAHGPASRDAATTVPNNGTLASDGKALQTESSAKNPPG